MKAKNLLWAVVALFATFSMTAVLSSCEGDKGGSSSNQTIVDDNEGGEETAGFPEIMPTLDAPGAGNVTIAIYVPSNTCKGVVLVGAGVGPEGTDDWAPANKTNPFAKLEAEEGWFTITIPYNAGLAVKAIAETGEGKADWPTQWGMNVEGADANVVILAGAGELDNSENDGEVKLTTLEDGGIVYVGIKAWKSAPCAERNKAGKATFTLTTETLPEGAIIGIVGALSESLNWNIDEPVIMTKGEGNVWTAEIDVQETCEYKYFYSLDGTTWSWDLGEDGNNRPMPLDLKAVDEVAVWKTKTQAAQ